MFILVHRCLRNFLQFVYFQSFAGTGNTIPNSNEILPKGSSMEEFYTGFGDW
uniref:Uncharacterized protein n=1 Tax=Rhizophora mucronata TaxID=61149 RepID=A0A2P2NIK3_RHIMU